MRFLLVLVLAVAACAAAVTPDDDHVELAPMSIFARTLYAFAEEGDSGSDNIEVVAEPEDGVEPTPRFIISWKVRRMIRKMQLQMPCGWPELGIPPLAPLKFYDRTFSLKRGIMQTINDVFKFRVDGLNEFIIKKFKLNVVTSKVTFDFIFNIQASAEKYDTNTIIDALQTLGISVQYEGDGSFEFGLKKLRIAGTMKYKIPVLWGSAKIVSLKTTVTVEKCTSNISGFLGESGINDLLNNQIENFVEHYINDNQKEISDKIENAIVPKVNKRLKGTDFWTLYDKIFKKGEDEPEEGPIVSDCIPPADPWA